MSAKKQENQTESARDAALGYAAVVLGIICFILSLAVVMAAVRFIVSLRPAPVATTGVTATAVSTVPSNAAYDLQRMA